MEEDGNGRVLDTGLRGEPQALQVLDNLLDKSEFLLGSGEAGVTTDYKSDSSTLMMRNTCCTTHVYSVYIYIYVF